MIDRRFLAGALGVLLGLTATEALAATKKKKTARKSHKKPAPKKAALPKPVEPPVPEATPPAVAAGLDKGEQAAEVERYCVWPGPALGYMVGKIEWLRLRDAAKTQPGCDIRRFHDAGLSCGGVPDLEFPLSPYRKGEGEVNGCVLVTERD